jgi:hypothetical protein
VYTYPDFNHEESGNGFWTIERAEQFLPKLRSIMDTIILLSVKINHLKSKGEDTEELSETLTKITCDLPMGIEIPDHVRGVATFTGWMQDWKQYAFVYRHPILGINHFCSLEYSWENRLKDKGGNYVQGKSNDVLATGNLEEIPANWRNYAHSWYDNES